MRVVDLLAHTLIENKIDTVFTVTGGGSMHLNDAFGRLKKFKIFYFHHEQSAAMAAEAFSRVTGNPGIVCVTSGPGGINTLNGVFGAHTDSIPMIVLSGQVRSDTSVKYYGSTSMRQLGDQEFPYIQDVTSHMTKKSVTLKKEDNFKKIFTNQIKLSNSGRKGPVWIDIPLDIQGLDIGKIPTNLKVKFPTQKKINVSKIQHILKKIKEAKYPIVYVGSGIRSANAVSDLFKFLKKYNLPVVSAWNSHDLIPNNSKYYAGRPGILGERVGNFVVEKSDLIIVLGCRLSIRQVGYNYKDFKQNTYKIMVDIDSSELNKPTININYKIKSDVKIFLDQMNSIDFVNKENEQRLAWFKWINFLNRQFPIINEKNYLSNRKKINPYVFINKVFKKIPANSIIVSGNGSACVMGFQAAWIKSKTRFFHNSGSASMGYDLPAAIGAAITTKKKIICLTGEGSLQMNLQELQTITHYDLNVLIIVINNNSYLSIKQTQDNFFGSPNFGVDEQSGVSFPNLKKIANAYDFDYVKLSNTDHVDKFLSIINNKQKGLVEVIVDQHQKFEPKVSSRRDKYGQIKSAPNYDMAPFLGEEKIKKVFEKLCKDEPV